MPPSASLPAPSWWVHALPVGHRWGHERGVTVLGDAAHLMSPFAGEGVNLAMFDGSELGKALAKHGNALDAASLAYEEAMFLRAAQSAGESLERLDMLFGAGTPHKLVARPHKATAAAHQKAMREPLINRRPTCAGRPRQNLGARRSLEPKAPSLEPVERWFPRPVRAG